MPQKMEGSYARDRGSPSDAGPSARWVCSVYLPNVIQTAPGDGFINGWCGVT
jgi:hypothetical protein